MMADALLGKQIADDLLLLEAIAFKSEILISVCLSKTRGTWIQSEYGS